MDKRRQACCRHPRERQRAPVRARSRPRLARLSRAVPFVGGAGWVRASAPRFAGGAKPRVVL